MVAKSSSLLLRGLANTLSGLATCQNHASHHFRYLTEKEQQQLALDKHAYRETLEEEVNVGKERARAEKECEKFMKEEQAHNELFRLEFESCTPNALGDLTMILKDPSGTISGTIHHKIINEGDFGKAITVRVVSILGNVFVFSPKQSIHALNITRANLVKVLPKDTVMGDGTGVGGGGMLDQEKIIKLLKEKYGLWGTSILAVYCIS
ncbi:transposase, MuDR, MULE transposase domain protein [Tanacetum coccineum]